MIDATIEKELKQFMSVQISEMVRQIILDNTGKGYRIAHTVFGDIFLLQSWLDKHIPVRRNPND